VTGAVLAMVAGHDGVKPMSTKAQLEQLTALVQTVVAKNAELTAQLAGTAVAAPVVTPATVTATPPSVDQLKRLCESLTGKAGNVTWRVSHNTGVLSLYVGKRKQPINLYRKEWPEVFAVAGEVSKFLTVNDEKIDYVEKHAERDFSQYNRAKTRA